MTPLMYAAREGALEAAVALAEGGAGLDVQDPDGSTAMIFAIINGHYDVAAMLLEKGANPNLADSAGMAALYATVDMHTLPFMHGRPYPKPSGRLGVEDFAKLLLGHGADVNQALKSPLLRRHNSTATQSLGEGTTPLLRAAASGDVAFMRLLLERGADPKVRQKNGTTMLMLASGFGRRGDHNADALEFERGTPEELLRAVKLCVDELKLDPSAANDQGDTALHVAHSADIVRYLAAHGARLDARNKRGQTPLAIALLRTDESNRQLRPETVAALKELDGGATPASTAETGAGRRRRCCAETGSEVRASTPERWHRRVASGPFGRERDAGHTEHGASAAAGGSAATADVGGTDGVVGEVPASVATASESKAGGLVLEGLDLSRPSAHAETWEKVILKLRGGLMPPAGMPRPAEPATTALVSYLESSLDAAAVAVPNAGRPALHRLNRAEYANAIRDLLALEVDAAVLLPPDDSSDGFDNNADVLGVSPALLERYLSAARVVASLALGDPKADPTTRVFRAPPDMSQRQHRDGLPLGTIGGLVATHTFPSDGEYVFKVKLHGDDARPGPRARIRQPGRGACSTASAIHLAEVGGAEDYVGSADNATDVLNNINARLTVRVPVTAGPHAIAAAFLGRSATQGGNRLQFFQRTNVDTTDHTGVPHIESVTLTGPFNAAGAGRTPSRDRILVCRPSSSGAGASLREADRRDAGAPRLSPAGDGAGGHPPAGVLQRRPQGRQLRPRHRARAPRRPDQPEVRLPRRAGRAGGARRRVTASATLELASRLSFFLWSSIPDDELVDVAAKGQLRQPAVLERQVRRMLADRRAEALVANFAGQWLQLRNLRAAIPDQNDFPDFDDNLRQAFRRETELLFQSVMREDRSVLDLLTADYTFVNERLARHYRIPERLRQPLPPRARHGRCAAGPARPRQHPAPDLAPGSHVAGAARQVDPRQPAGHAAAAAAGQRPGARGKRGDGAADGARADGDPPQEPVLRVAATG